MTTARDVRHQLVQALRLDLIGPDNDSPLAREVLRESPSRWYLTGFLVPLEGDEKQRKDEESDEELGEIDETGANDDATASEPPSAKTAYLPSSMGLSFLATADTREAHVRLSWGDYRRSGGDAGAAGGGRAWQREPRETSVRFPIPESSTAPVDIEVPDSAGLWVVFAVRPVVLPPISGWTAGPLPAGTRSVSVFLVNRRKPAEDPDRDTAFAFQARFEVETDVPFVARPDLRGLTTEDPDEKIADLQYRDAFEYAVGHGVATDVVCDAGGACRRVHTAWIPSAEVERVVAAEIEGVELRMESLAGLASADDARAQLSSLPRLYSEWLAAQRGSAPTAPPRRAETAGDLLQRAQVAAGRIEQGIAALQDPDVLAAFKMANAAVATAFRQRRAIHLRVPPASVEPPEWRLFQLAFILMNLAALADPAHADREVVDLLFFPTGGGKTEAYLGLAAFTLVHRRLRNPGLASAGMAVLMRYTLRLLTLDQLSRAATLLCALEIEREKDPARLGTWPFEIGLWVGRAATPNRMGDVKDKGRETARARTIAYQNDDRKPSPIPLEECPWCGTRFNRNSFHLVPKPDKPRDLRITCANRDCKFRGERSLPIVAVDEPLYRRLPCFVIATVDKFAALPWNGRVGTLFGKVERFDEHGFYGPLDPGVGRPLAKPLLPPDLVIQDELHLISGPMGTMAGLYETAIDELCARPEDGPSGKARRPKIIASTATVRRADAQIRALFGRVDIEVFPQPCPDRRDSFFARTVATTAAPGRLYLGIAAQGRSLKVVLLRAYRTLLTAAQKSYVAAGGKRNAANPADPYMTLLGYFNSLRELGGSRRIISDEVHTIVKAYADRKREGEAEGLFANRTIDYDVVELTSRVSTNKVADAKRRLSLPFSDDGPVDVAIATNMISVGLDITRLGLMVVLGQPKTTSEYIQATSRVGRETGRPGLVVTLLNVHRPRDRSHYERFAAWHASFYRGVEALSVTPFSRRALDRGLAGALVGLARHAYRPMTPARGASAILEERGALEGAAGVFARRAAGHAKLPAADKERLREEVRLASVELLDRWAELAESYRREKAVLQYNANEEGGAKPLLYDFLDPELRHAKAGHRWFRAGRSLRDVEPSVNLWRRSLDGRDDFDEEGR